MTVIVHERQQRVSDELIEAFRSHGVGDIGHFARWGFVDPAIRPVWRDLHIAGNAVTVWMPSINTSITRKAIEVAQPGDVLVIDAGGQSQAACWGGFVTMLAQAKGLSGLIVDGAVTDSMEITALGWPVYSRSLSGRVGGGNPDEGEVNTTINCGGVPVSPGDLIVADDDGILVVRPDDAASLLDAVETRFGQTQDIRQWLRDGKSIMDYPGVAEFLNRG